MSDFLRDYSKKDAVWDKHKRAAVRLAEFLDGDEDFANYAQRLRETARFLTFAFVDDFDTGESKLKLRSAFFSRWRHDPVSIWRRSLKWRFRWFEALPRIFETHPTHRWLFLTLTVKNCEITSLNAQCKHLNQSWRRMAHGAKLRQFLDSRVVGSNGGYYKGLEVTRGADGSAHPHLHLLLHLPASYFKGKNYISQAEFADLWKKAARLDYDPVVDIRAVKPKRGGDLGIESMRDSVLEVTKYSTKTTDLLQCPNWTKEFIRQMRRVRALEVSGTLKAFLSDVEALDDDLVNVNEDEQDAAIEREITRLFFEFDEAKKIRRYRKFEREA